MGVIGFMTPEQAARARKPRASEGRENWVSFGPATRPLVMTEHFQRAVGLPVRHSPIIPSVTDRLRRAQLLLEEVLETFAAMGLRVELNRIGEAPNRDVSRELRLAYIEGSGYDVVETADGLSDINVIVAGTALEFGIPMSDVDFEVYSSNMTKLRPNGTPIVNGITEGYREGESGYQPNAPVGKILKPEGFVPANIPAVLLAHEEGRS